MRLVDLPRDLYKYKLTYGFFDDFNEYVSGDLWTLVTTNDGAATLSSTVPGGVINIKTALNDAGTEDNETGMLISTSKSFAFAADQPLRFGARLSITEANTDDANILVGVSNVIVDGILADDGAGPVATENYGAYFYKVDGSTSWYVGHQNNTTKTEYELTSSNSLDGKAHTDSSTMQVLEMVCLPTGGTNMDVLYYIDGVHVYKSSVTFTADKTMSAILAVKDGSSSHIETISVDYAYCYQTR